MILEVNERGELVVPAELVKALPRSLMEAERRGDTLVLRPADLPLATPFRIEEFPVYLGGPTDPAMTFRRGEIYGDDVR